MSKLLESLIGEMKAIYGNFGDVESDSLTEARAMKVSKKPAKKLSKRDKDISHYQKSQKSRIARNLSDFHKHADKEGAKSAARPRPAKLDRAALGNVDRPTFQKNTGGSKHSSVGGGGRHTPFKRSSQLGKGPGNPPGFRRVWGPRDHHEKKCWNCHCGNIYNDGCVCIGTGATKDCPQGHRKKVHIKKAYRRAYNKVYHAGYDSSVHRWVGSKGGK